MKFVHFNIKSDLFLSANECSDHISQLFCTKPVWRG